MFTIRDGTVPVGIMEDGTALGVFMDIGGIPTGIGDMQIGDTGADFIVLGIVVFIVPTTTIPIITTHTIMEDIMDTTDMPIITIEEDEIQTI